MVKTPQIVFFIIPIFIIIALVLIFTLKKSSSDQQDQPDQPEVFVTGYYDGETFFRDAGTSRTGASLPAGAGYSSFLAKYNNNGIVDWAARQDGAGTDYGNGVVTDSQNNVYITGQSSLGISFYSQGSDGLSVTLLAGTNTSSFLAKYSNSGFVEWAARQDGGGSDYGKGVATDSQTNVYMTGINGSAGITFYSSEGSDGLSVTLPGGTGNGTFLAKYSNNGIVDWAARQGGSGTDYAGGVATDSQNNVYMSGYNTVSGISFYSAGSSVASFTLPDIGAGYSSFLAKYSNNGSVVWAAKQDGAGTDISYDVTTDSQNNVFMTGYNGVSGITFYSKHGSVGLSVTLPTGTGTGSFLAKYSNSGIVSWAARQDGGGTDAGRGVATDSQNNVYMTGYNGSQGISFYSQGNNDGVSFTLPAGTGRGSFLAKYSNSGFVEWAARQDGGGDDDGNAVATDSQNNVYMTGYNGTSGISFYSAGNPNTPAFTLEKIGDSNHSIFTSKYNSNGEFQWAAVIGSSVSGNPNSGYSIAAT